MTMEEGLYYLLHAHWSSVRKGCVQGTLLGVIPEQGASHKTGKGAGRKQMIPMGQGAPKWQKKSVELRKNYKKERGVRKKIWKRSRGRGEKGAGGKKYKRAGSKGWNWKRSKEHWPLLTDELQVLSLFFVKISTRLIHVMQDVSNLNIGIDRNDIQSPIIEFWIF